MDTPGIGHNADPNEQVFDGLKERTDALVAAAERALENHPEIGDEEIAGTYADFLTQLRAATKDIETERKAQKQPHIDAGKAVDEKFGGLKRLLDICKAKIEPIQTKWLQEVQRRQDEERRRKEREAYEAMQAEQEAAKKASEAGGIAATVAAEEAAKKASEAVAEAEQAAKAKPQMRGQERTVSLRTSWHARITDYDAALGHYRDHPKVRDLIEALASADARNPEKRITTIPGVEFYNQQKAA